MDGLMTPALHYYCYCYSRVSECEAYLDFTSSEEFDRDATMDSAEFNVSYLSRICKIDGKR